MQCRRSKLPLIPHLAELVSPIALTRRLRAPALLPMSTMTKNPPGACLHYRWCRADHLQAHADTCPTKVLALTDEQVDKFCEEFVELTVHKVLVGKYDGRQASISGYPDAQARRWLAENLMMCARADAQEFADKRASAPDENGRHWPDNVSL